MHSPGEHGQPLTVRVEQGSDTVLAVLDLLEELDEDRPGRVAGWDEVSDRLDALLTATATRPEIATVRALDTARG